jgi:hypothetical protein
MPTAAGQVGEEEGWTCRAARAYLKEIPLLRSATMHACLHTDRCLAFGTLFSALLVALISWAVTYIYWRLLL